MTLHAFYSLDDLAVLWKGVKRSTIYHWIKLERRAGRGPDLSQTIVRMRAGLKSLMIREDFARKLQDKYYCRVDKRRLRANGKGKP